MVDLWIRSQCRMHLLKCNNIVVSQTTHSEAQVMGYVDPELSYIKLGKFKTKERAMEVLNEIETIIIDNPKEICLVYEMPQE